MQINDICRYFTSNYHASVADSIECERYLDDNQRLVLALRFMGKHENYALLSENDLNSFTPIQREKIIRTQESPFDDVLLLFFVENQDGLSCKIINGMGSRLLKDYQSLLCEDQS